MPQFLVLPENINEAAARARIVGEEAHHLARVLRGTPGDDILLFDGAGRRWRGMAETVSPDGVDVSELCILPDAEELSDIWLIVAMVKGERWDWILEKSTELGVGRILPVYTEHTVVKPAPTRLASRMERWRKRILAAAKQCERGRLPLLLEPEPVAAMLASLPSLCPEEERWVFAARQGEERPAPQGNSQRILLAIGPEGGWSPKELEAFARQGFSFATLGSRILRSDTAALAALVWAQKSLIML